MNKKGLIGAAALLLVLALLIVGYTVIKNRNGAEEAPTGVAVNTYNSADAVSFSFEKEDDSLSFTRDAKGYWHLADDEELPIFSSSASAMINALSGLTADREIISGEAPDYGFDEPSLTVEAKYQTGDKLSLVFGATNDFNGNVYLKDRTNGKVYLVSASAVTPFNVTRNGIIETDEMPLITAEDVTSLTVKDADGNEATVTDSAALNDGATIFLSLGFDPEGCRSALGEDRRTLGIAGDSFARINYKTETTVTNSDGTTSKVDVDETFTIYLGNETEYGGETYHYYTVPGSNIAYLADDASYYTLTRYATYTNTEEGETK